MIMRTNSPEIALRSLRELLARSAPVAEVNHAIALVAAFGDKSTIVPLLSLLEDGATFDESMFSLVHAAEAFDDATYVTAFLDVVSSLRGSAPRWASILLMRILNNEATAKELVLAAPKASPAAKSALAWLCESIDKRGAEFSRKTLPVLIAVTR
jgi:hypothetical protein